MSATSWTFSNLWSVMTVMVGIGGLFCFRFLPDSLDFYRAGRNSHGIGFPSVAFTHGTDRGFQTADTSASRADLVHGGLCAHRADLRRERCLLLVCSHGWNWMMLDS